MSSLQTILGIGRSSLLAHQSAIATASNNTANADVVGYSKRDVMMRSVAGGSGVGIESVRRRADIWVERRMLFERSLLGTHLAQSQGLAAVELQLDHDGGLGSLIDAFFGSIRTLGSSPTDTGARIDVLAAASALAEGFNVTAGRIALERRQADLALEGAIDDVNALVSEIADLNAAINHSEATGVEASTERDRRDLLVGQLAEHVQVQILVDDAGSWNLLLAGGRPIVQGTTAARLTTTADPALGGMRRVDLVDGSGVATDVTATLRQGRVGGLLALRDDTLAGVASRIDALAYDLATSFNAVHAAGFGLDGSSGRDLFAVPGTIPGAAATLSLAPGMADRPDFIAAATDAATAVGGNENLLALADLADADLAGGSSRTFAEEFAAIIGDVGRSAARQRLGAVQGEVQLAQLQALDDAQTGVSLDEELMDITRFERAYQAAARIISTLDELYQTVLSL
jgi:flagellar hook-associated protein 1 FlgK